MLSELPDLFIAPRETLLDRRVHLESDLALEPPDVPPWCGLLPRLRPRLIDIGGARLFYEEQGEGMPLVLLHGGPGHSHHGFHPAFSRLGDGVRAIYYDQRGCGRSDCAPGSGYSVDQSIDDLEALRQALGISRWTVLGHSYGGFLAQCYAARHPAAVAGLLLVCSAIPSREMYHLDPSPLPDFLSPEEQAAQQAIFGNPALTPAQLMYNALVNGRWKRNFYYRPTRETLARIARYEWVHDEGYYDAVATSMLDFDLTGDFDAGALPTLIVEGHWDLTWNTDKPSKLHRLHPHARLEIFPNSGHMPFNDEPKRFFTLLDEFLAILPIDR
jgi:proline iminopeptidase